LLKINKIKNNMKYTSAFIAALLVAGTDASHVQWGDDYRLRAVLGALAGDYGGPSMSYH
jgi:hypothetical protein